jgi:glycosyltransferase involved in cell wall biosynthesis
MTGQDTELPLVSIVVPVFNGERFLRESLDSILTQTYPRLEVLLIDDASTDGTPGIAAAYGDRLTYVRQPKTRGIYGNANDGIARAQGKYVAVYHADDLYDPRIVEREVGYLEAHPGAGAVFCSDIFVDGDNREFGRLQLPVELRGESPLPYPAILNALLTYKNRFLVCPTAMVPAAVYAEVGVYRDAQFKNTSDLDMWLRIARAYPIGILEAYLLRYRRGHGSSSERYHRLRVDPERFFTIMDRYLADGGRELATPSALRAYEGHRAEDRLKLIVHHYILGRPADAQPILEQVRMDQILASPRLQRGRMLVLYAALRAIIQVPRLPSVARLLQQHWYGRPPVAGARSRPLASARR